MPEESVKPAIESKDLPQLARHLAHELNNPISAISSSAFLIQDFIETAEGGVLETEMIKPFIESIREECLKLKGVVEEFAKFITTESVLRMPLELSEFLRMRVGEMVKDGIPVTFQEGPTFTLEADAGALQYALRALASGALDAGASKVTVSIDPEQTCTIVIQDDRPPMGVEEVEGLFKAVPARRGAGLGLKLPLAKRIAELHGGELTATSSAQEFKVCLRLSNG